MEKIIDGLYVGDDNDDHKARGDHWAILVCAKDGPWGHRHMLGYTTRGAPRDKNYYFVERGNRAALNLIDSDDPSMIQKEVMDFGIEFIKKHVDKGQNVLVHCNEGHSRGPTVALAYLRAIGEMPGNFHQSQSKFKTLYPKYNPNHGVNQWLRSEWAALKNKLL